MLQNVFFFVCVNCVSVRTRIGEMHQKNQRRNHQEKMGVEWAKRGATFLVTFLLSRNVERDGFARNVAVKRLTVTIKHKLRVWIRRLVHKKKFEQLIARETPGKSVKFFLSTQNLTLPTQLTVFFAIIFVNIKQQKRRLKGLLREWHAYISHARA